MIDFSQLIHRAEAARAAAYTPYSHFSVGAALLCGQIDSSATVIITGCNIENKAYGSSMCAERTALFKAVSEGFSNFLAIAIVGGPEGSAPLDYCAPCGACRQVLSEFAPPDFQVILAKSESDYKICTLAELLPEAFSFARD